MPVRVFDDNERKELKRKMLDAGFQLIKEHGMTHTSVRKITSAVGLGASTFYNFFPSKEMFVLELIQYQRERQIQYFNEILDGREKMTAEEGKKFAKRIIFNQESILQYLTAEDEKKLEEACGNAQGIIGEAPKENMMEMFLSHIEGVRADVNQKVIANLINIMAFALFHRNELYEDALEETLDQIYELLFSLLLEDE